MRQTTQERFWEKVDKSGECWLWLASGVPRGYGRFWKDGAYAYAHRVSWEMANGPIPPGLHIDHMCHTPGCVNPAHLRAVTNRQNSENRSGKQSNNRSGVVGVSWYRNGWRARVRRDGKDVFRRDFKTLAEARAAVVAARLELFTHNDRDRVDSI